MTQDEIIELTRQAGGFAATPKFLETFAKLVADYVRSPEWLARRTEAAIAAEREIIADQFWGCVMSDLEHGVKSLNEKAAFDFQKNMPDLSKFGRWLNERGEA